MPDFEPAAMAAADTTTRYTVLDPRGQVLAEDVSLAGAGAEILLYDGGEAEVREDGFLWRKAAGGDWHRTRYYSVEDDPDAAWADVCRQITRDDQFLTFAIYPSDGDRSGGGSPGGAGETSGGAGETSGGGSGEKG